jgi:flagellin
MIINHNIAALRANNLLSKNNKLLDESLEKLSSGLRINKAADDAAGLAISEKMRTQIAALDQASRNAYDGISVIQTAEGGLTEVESMLQRMRELSVQASNGTYSQKDNEAIQTEINQLNDEIQRLSNTMEFNTMKLLDGSIDRNAYCDNRKISIISESDTVDIGNYQLKVKQDARQAVVVGNKFALGKDVNNVPYTIGTKKISAQEAGDIVFNGQKVSVKEGDTIEGIFNKIASACDVADINVFAASDTTTNTGNISGQAGYTSIALNGDTPNPVSLVFVSEEYGSKEEISINCENAKLCDVLGLSTGIVKSKGVDAIVQRIPKSVAGKSSLFEDTATVTTEGNKIIISDRDDFKMELEAETGVAGTTFTDTKITASNAAASASAITAGADQTVNITVMDTGIMQLQIGANAGQTMAVRIPKVNPKTLGVDRLNVLTKDGAEEAMGLLDKAINTVSSIRSKLGAYQNRLEHSIANLGTTSQNMTESLSRISDVDMAEEMANYTQKNVLSQAGTAMLAQANERPQTILSLIQR